MHAENSVSQHACALKVVMGLLWESLKFKSFAWSLHAFSLSFHSYVIYALLVYYLTHCLLPITALCKIMSVLTKYLNQF